MFVSIEFAFKTVTAVAAGNTTVQLIDVNCFLAAQPAQIRQRIPTPCSARLHSSHSLEKAMNAALN